MKLLLKSLLPLAAIVLLASCAEKYKEPDSDYLKSKLIPTFTLPTEGNDAPQRNQDAVGIYMYRSGSLLTSESSLASNMRYIVSATGDLTYTTTENIIRVPENGSAVDFIAYYPYSTSSDGFVLPIDLTDASSPNAMDLHYAGPATGYGLNNKVVPLVFERRMSKVIFEISNKVSTGSIQGMSVSMEGVHTLADFDLRTGQLIVNRNSTGTIQMTVTPTATGAIAEAIVLPSDGMENITVHMRQGTARAEASFNEIEFVKGEDLTVAIELGEGDPGGSSGGGTDPEPDVYPAWFELPYIEQGENTMWVYHMFTEAAAPTQRNYSMLYDRQYKVAYWVAYPLVTGHMGDSGRTDEWAYDPKIGNAYQADLTLGSYNGANWDRGHQLPSADRTFSYNANASTFYSSNMTPQFNRLNQGVWGTLETRARAWSANCDTLYMVTGCVVNEPANYTTDKAGTNVAIPNYYYKAVAQYRRADNSYKTAAFWFENAQPSSSSVVDYRMTVSQLEELTGITFFPSLSDQVKGTLESSYWN